MNCNSNTFSNILLFSLVAFMEVVSVGGKGGGGVQALKPSAGFLTNSPHVQNIRLVCDGPWQNRLRVFSLEKKSKLDLILKKTKNT